MVDFSALMRRPAGEAKKPEPLPAGLYSATIKGHELGDSNKNKTPYVRFSIGLIAPPDDVDLPEGTDLSKRSLRRDYFFTEDALWRLDDFIRSCGIVPAGRNYEEIVPDLHGAMVTAEVQQNMNEKTNEIFNQIGKLYGEAGA